MLQCRPSQTVNFAVPLSHWLADNLCCAVLYMHFCAIFKLLHVAVLLEVVVSTMCNVHLCEFVFMTKRDKAK